MLVLLSSCLNTGLAADEKGVWDIWKKTEAEPVNLTELIADCTAFKQANASDPLRPVIDGILAWAYFKSEKMADGAKLLVPVVNARNTPMQKATSDMARTWLTRIDRIVVKMVLQEYYKREIAFPAKVDDAIDKYADTIKASKVDRWGKPWNYELVGFKHLTKVPKDQKYSLQSILLGEDSDYEKALEIPFGGRINIVPMKMGLTTPGAESVYFKKADDEKSSPIHIKLGERVGGVALGYVGKNILVLTDGNHWKLLPKPQR